MAFSRKPSKPAGGFTLVAHSPHCRIAPVSALVAILA